MAKLKGKLTSKQAAFCVEYLKDHNATQAAIRAGFSAKTAQSIASRLVVKSHVQAELARLQERVEDAAVVSRSWVVGKLVTNVERSMQAERVFDEQGQPTGEYRYEGQVANRALELLGKDIGMWADRLDVKVQGSVESLVADMRSGIPGLAPPISESAHAEVVRFIAKAMGFESVASASAPGSESAEVH